LGENVTSPAFRWFVSFRPSAQVFASVPSINARTTCGGRSLIPDYERTLPLPFRYGNLPTPARDSSRTFRGRADRYVTVHANLTEAQFAQSRALFFEGVEHLESGRLEPARACFEQCRALTPGRPSVLANLGITLFRLGRLDEAIPLLRQATTSDPSLVQAWVCLGLANEAQQRWEAAVEALERALALSPQLVPLWMTLGQAHLQLGRPKDALRAFDRAAHEDPTCAPAWTERGSVLRELRHFEEARTCFEKALALGGDPELNGYFLASVRDGDAPPTAPRSYVERIFDQYAADFQSHVVETLGYQGFETLLKPLVETAKRYRHVLDLGCGTGLCGPLIAAQADVIDGVDVSGAMLEQARKLGIYRELVQADLGEFLDATALRPDLILAADVFIYVGDLAAVFRSARRILEPGGCLAFTVELAKTGRNIQLLPSLRYAHSEAYVRRLAAEAGFARVRTFEAPLRNEQAAPILGLYVYLD
jgi:predicted TPR repeat methyltransferase